VFEVDELGSDSRHIEKVWVTQSTSEAAFIAVAESHWQIVVTTLHGQTGVVIQGPNDNAKVTPIPPEAEFFGIVLRLGTFMPAVSLAHLVGGAEARPNATSRTFWLNGSRWEIPTPENADVFVDRLMRQEVLIEDRFVAQSLHAEDAAVSLRTMQRRVRRATGMTQSAIRQITRAHAAVDALGHGAPLADVANDLGYADQAHLTRSLRRFIGQTPAQVLNTGGHWSASSPLRGSVVTRL
jgi:AraC-like DNA-binding protein